MASTQVNTYFAKGIREGLTNTVADLFADDCPLMAMAEKIQATNVYHEWQTDALASAVKTGVVQGADISYSQPATRTRVGNYTHIRLRNWDVTFTQMAVTVAGVKDQVAREVMKALKALTTDYESIFLNTVAKTAGTTSHATRAGGLQKSVITNTAVGSAAKTTATFALTEDVANLVMQKIWTAGGDPKALFCGGYEKRVISKRFTAKTGFTFTMEQSTRQAIANINKYEGSFGTLDIIPDRFHMKKRVSIITPDQIKIAVLRDIEQYKGAPTASSIKGWCEAEMTLQYGNEKAHGKIKNLRTGGAIPA